MNPSVSLPPTQQPLIGVIRIGRSYYHRTSEPNRMLTAALPRLEAHFGMPFYMHPYEYMDSGMPLLKPQHKGVYHYTCPEEMPYYPLAKAISEWIITEQAYWFPHGISLIKGADGPYW